MNTTPNPANSPTYVNAGSGTGILAPDQPSTSKEHLSNVSFGASPARECGCPAWALRCAHHDGLRLTLADCGGPPCCGAPAYRYCVAFSYENAREICPLCHNVPLSEEVLDTNDFSAALAAFHAAEAKLLGRAE